MDNTRRARFRGSSIIVSGTPCKAQPRGGRGRGRGGACPRECRLSRWNRYRRVDRSATDVRQKVAPRPTSLRRKNRSSRSGGMADATDSKSVIRKGVRVQVPPSALGFSWIRARKRSRPSPKAAHNRRPARHQNSFRGMVHLGGHPVWCECHALLSSRPARDGSLVLRIGYGEHDLDKASSSAPRFCNDDCSDPCDCAGATARTACRSTKNTFGGCDTPGEVRYPGTLLWFAGARRPETRARFGRRVDGFLRRGLRAQAAKGILYIDRQPGRRPSHERCRAHFVPSSDPGPIGRKQPRARDHDRDHRDRDRGARRFRGRCSPRGSSRSPRV